MTPARLAELLALEEKLSRLGSDVTWMINFMKSRKPLPLPCQWGNLRCTRRQPDADFQRQAALWGVALKEPVTAEELASFVAYWQAEGKVFHHIQWQQKLARSIQIGRASNGGMPKRDDVNSVSEPDSHIPPGLEDNDENVGDLMKRLQKMMPPNVEPAFKRARSCLHGKRAR